MLSEVFVFGAGGDEGIWRPAEGIGVVDEVVYKKSLLDLWNNVI